MSVDSDGTYRALRYMRLLSFRTRSVMYLEANGVDRSPTTAFGLLFSAAKQGQPHAMAMVAKAY